MSIIRPSVAVLTFISTISLLPLISDALAQQVPAQKQPPAAAVGSGQDSQVGAETHTVRFVDWLLRCATTGTIKSCEIVQTLTLQQTNAPVALLAVGRTAKGEPIKFVAQVPNNIAIASGLTVEIEGEKPVKGEFRRCIPTGCFADFILADDLRKKWQAKAESGFVIYADGQGARVKLPISFNGFAPAVERLLRDSP